MKSWIKWTWIIGFVGVLWALPASAQVITPTVMPLNDESLKSEIEKLRKELAALETAGAAEARTRAIKTQIDALERADSQKGRNGAVFLSQAGFEGGTTGPAVSIDTAHLFFNNRQTRLYLRSTLPTESVAAAEPEGTLNDRIRAAVLDPYGGLLYVAVGKLIPVDGQNHGPDQGLFFDLRAGAKFVQLPGEASGGTYKATAFGLISAGARVRQTLWPTPDAANGVGTIEASALLVANRAVDRAVSPLVDHNGALAGWVMGLNIGIGIELVDGVVLTLRGTPWSNKDLSKDFTIGFVLKK